MQDFGHEKVASSILRAIQQVIARGLADPRLDGVMLTITSIDLAPDSRNATLHVSVLPETAEKKAIAAVSHASAHIRREAGELVRLRSLPQLHFTLDQSLKKQAKVIAALGQEARAREQSESGDAPPGPGDAGEASKS